MRNDDRFVPGRCLAPLLTCPFILIGALSLWYALIVHDLGVPCVANVSSRSTSLSFRITALWGTQNGSLLPRCLIMAAFVATAMAKCWDRDKPLLPWVTVMMALVLAFFPFLVLVLGWGGYWGWDPLESRPLIAWLIATAFLHFAVIQKKYGAFKNWNALGSKNRYVHVMTIAGPLNPLLHAEQTRRFGTWANPAPV